MAKLAVVLAAGASRRFGSQKLLATLQDGRTLLETSVAQCSAVFETTKVVVSSGLNDRISDLKLTAEVLVNPHSEQGLSSSIRFVLEHSGEASGYLFALGDMPFVSTATLSKLHKRMTLDNIVVPEYQGRWGNPVAFGTYFKKQLMQLSGDRGARPLVLAHPDHREVVKTNDAGVVTDIDHPRDLSTLDQATMLKR